MNPNDIIDIVIRHVVRSANDKLGEAAGEWLEVLIKLMDAATRESIIGAINSDKMESVDGEFIDESSEG